MAEKGLSPLLELGAEEVSIKPLDSHAFADNRKEPREAPLNAAEPIEISVHVVFAGLVVCLDLLSERPSALFYELVSFRLVFRPNSLRLFVGFCRFKRFVCSVLGGEDDQVCRVVKETVMGGAGPAGCPGLTDGLGLASGLGLAGRLGLMGGVGLAGGLADLFVRQVMLVCAAESVSAG